MARRGVNEAQKRSAALQAGRRMIARRERPLYRLTVDPDGSWLADVPNVRTPSADTRVRPTMRTTHAIRLATQADVAAVRAISDQTGLSDDSEAGAILEPMDKDHTWIVLESPIGEVIGAAYFGPESHSDRVWNLYFLAVTREHQRGGTGSALLAHVETDLRRRGDEVAKLLLIETSSIDTFAPARAFYRKQGYVEEARIREYYGPRDDKVVFWKLLNADETGES